MPDHAQMANRRRVEGDVPDRDVEQLQNVHPDVPVDEQPPPTPGHRDDRIGVLLRREDVGECVLARCALQPGQQPALIRARPPDPQAGLLVLQRRVVQIEDVEKFVGDPVGAGEPAAAGRVVGLLDTPGFGHGVLGADHQTVLARCDQPHIVPVELVSTERIDDLHGFGVDPQLRMEPEPPRVHQREDGQQDQGTRDPRRAALLVDQVGQHRHGHAGGQSEDPDQHQGRGPGAPHASGRIGHQPSPSPDTRAGAGQTDTGRRSEVLR